MSPIKTRILIVALGVIIIGGVIQLAVRAELSRTSKVPTVAFIPQGAGSMLWEVGHSGASAAAEKLKLHLYWNAPTSENDVTGQVSLIDKLSDGTYQGLVLAPNHPLTVLGPLRRALETGVPVVVVSTPLELAPNKNLAYVVNDDLKMGEIAAAEIARLLRGKGSVVFAGQGRYAPGVMRRALGAESFLADRFPAIHIVSRLGGAYNISRTEELIAEAVNEHSGIQAILSFTATSTRGVYAALKGIPSAPAIHLVGCEQDFDLMGYVASGEIAAIAAENTYLMSYQAVELVAASSAGKPFPAMSLIPPLLITRENLDTPKASLFMSFPR